ncbi:hypothetical protein PBY51_014392 [Eleginops maclovinus]|uniref:Uncharacterized protein n=1 Tax=Eleginops maclovinus TaxID=56733 RepID=A0AAN7WV89_ELEMC|nr:hypothetical protein PBY51_014392 [Eleginops maclovinus]
MSTSDAGELELRVVGGEKDTSQYRTARGTPTATAREQQDETFKQQNYRDDETATGQQCHQTAIRQEATLKALILKVDRHKEEEAAHCGESKVQSQKPIEPKFTSCLLFRFSRNPQLNHKKEIAPCLQSLTETQRAETENSNLYLINRTTSPPDTSIKTACGSASSERIPFPAKKREKAITVNNKHISPLLPYPKDLQHTDGERSPNASNDYHTQLSRPASSPRSPFSPFASLSPVSPFASQDVSDDNVFFSPKLQRRRDTPSPCEQGEGFSLGGSRRSRASTGPPSAGPGQDKEGSASSYADLKYGIEPGRSFSVSSVLSSRPSGPGRISTGSRYMSVGDLSESALTCEDNGKDLDQWSVHPDWTTEKECQPSKDCRKSYLTSDPGKMRSRSLPRSLTRRLANWSSEVPVSPSAKTTTAKQARLWSPSMNNCHFAWNTEGPPTPPPTPPLSPVSRRMSQPPSLSSPTYPSSSGALMQVDSQSSKGLRLSRGYETSLSTFEESTDSSSDTTTDDEYYLETGEDEEKEKETEL